MFRRRGTGRAATDRKGQRATDPLPSPHLIDLRRVVKDYVTDAGPFRALDASTCRSIPASSSRVVGRSGSGKSTLMNMMTGIDRADRRHGRRRGTGPRAS